MSIVLSLVAMMMIQWQYGRYIMAYHVENDNKGRIIAEAALNHQMALWAQAGNSPTAGVTQFVTITDPTYGSCKVGVTYYSNTTVQVQFDPCATGTCTDSPCAY